jgi:hypothetical protein
MKFLVPSIGLAAIAVAAFANLPANAQTATPTPPPPPIPSAQATYAPTPAPTPHLPPGALPSPSGNSATVNIGRSKGATPAPPKDVDANRVGISGVWEVAIQEASGVRYTHFKLTQTGTVLTGQYLDGNGKKYPVSGTISGKDVRLIVTMPNTAPLMFTGTQDGGTDMVGTIDNTKDVVGFTAEYRPKYKWIDNLTPGTGGLGNPGGIPQ